MERQSSHDEPDRVDEIISRLNDIEEKLSKLDTIEDRLTKLETAPSIIPRPMESQPITPDLYAAAYPELSFPKYPMRKNNQVNIEGLLSESRQEVLRTLASLLKTRKSATAQIVADAMGLSRSTVSGRLNTLEKLGYVKKLRGKNANFSLTEEAQEIL